MTLPGGSPGSTSGARPRRRTRKRVPGGQACHGAWPGTAWRSNVATTITISLSRGLTTHRKNRWGRVRCQTGGSESRGSRRTRPRQQRLALGIWNVTSLGGKEPELVREVEHRCCPRCEVPGRSGDTHKSPAECRYVGVHPSGREGRFPTPKGYGGGNSVPMQRIAVQSIQPSWRP